MGMFTKRDMENRVKICYAGRFGEKLLDSNDPDIISDGAYADIMEATKIIKSMVTECGMGGCGMLNLNVLGVDEKELFNEVSEISSTLENATASLILEKKEIVLRLAEELMDKETLYAEDIRKMILSVWFLLAKKEETELKNGTEFRFFDSFYSQKIDLLILKMQVSKVLMATTVNPGILCICNANVFCISP